MEWAQAKAGFAFAPEQKEAVKRALCEKLSVITGGPGTGKTTILRALVDILRAKKARVVLAAPTGRASQRMAESTGAFAQTIHRLLKFDPASGRFTVDADAPLKCDCVIVDEASMLDTRLASSLLQAVPNTSHLVMVGDIHQLPSVGAGNVLKDLISSGAFTITELARVFRQKEKSGIVTLAHRILSGECGPPPPKAGVGELDLHHDLHFLGVARPESCLETVLQVCCEWLPRHHRGDPLMEVQVIAPMHKGVVGISNLNRVLQQALNGESPSVSFGNQVFRKGDKVIQTVNNYEKAVFNGDLGRIHSVAPEEGGLSVSFEDRIVDYDRAAMAEIQLAYAITVHKSQGSEFPVVVVPLLKQHFMMLQRNLLYTAITRGRRKVILVGDPAAYAMAVANAESITRRTDLARKIQAGAR